MNLIKKVSIILLCIMVFSFCVPNIVQAETYDNDTDAGGKLLKPVVSLVVALGDGAITLLQNVVFKIPDSLINIDRGSSFWSKILTAGVIIVGVLAAVALCVLPGTQAGGIALAIGVAKAVIVVTVAGVASTMVYPIATRITASMLPGNFQLPLFSVTPKEIFSNELLLTDVDFFTPLEDETEIKLVSKQTVTTLSGTRLVNNGLMDKVYTNTKTKDDPNKTYYDAGIGDYDYDTIYYDYTAYNDELNEAYSNWWKALESVSGNANMTNIIFAWGDVSAVTQPSEDFFNELVAWYTNYRFQSDVEKLNKAIDKLNEGYRNISEQILHMDFNLLTAEEREKIAEKIDGLEIKLETVAVASEETNQSTAKILQSTVSKWYRILRDIAIVALLSILVYIGIRILLSSASSDKAKYKQLLVDWLIGLCLLFVMQYIMSFSNIIVDKVTEMVVSMTQSTSAEEGKAIVDDDKLTKEEEEKLKSSEYGLFIIDDVDVVKKAYKALIDDSTNSSNETYATDNTYKTYFRKKDGTIAGSKTEAEELWWPANSELSLARIKMQLLHNNGQTWESIGYGLIYVVLVIFTFIFLFTYVRRVLYMAFLTIIAPLVAMTYPVDKIHDGKAQAFGMWLKEYIFNLLIQPMHLILYTILIGAAMDLVCENIIYVACALGFMIPAEKLMRKFFGFEKAQTPGMLGGAAGAAMMMAGMNKLLSKGPKGGKDGSGKDGGSDSEKNDSNVKTVTPFDTDDAFINGQQEREQIGQPEGPGGPEQQEGPGGPEQQEGPDGPEQQEGPDGPEQQEGPDGPEQQEGPGRQNQPRGPGRPQQPEQANDGFSRFKKGLGRSARYYAHDMKKKMINKGKNMHMGRKIGGLVLGATAGTLGLAAGIASGDPSKALQYTGAAALGGYKLGEGTAKGLRNTFTVEGTGDIFKENYYGKEEYRQKQIDKIVKQKQKDMDLMWKLEDELGSKEAASSFMQDELPTVMKYGDFDNNTLSAMAQMRNQGFSTNEAIAAALISERDLGGKDYNTRSAKAKKEFEDTIKRRGQESERHLSGDELTAFTNRTIDAVKALDRIRFKV